MPTKCHYPLQFWNISGCSAYGRSGYIRAAMASAVKEMYLQILDIYSVPIREWIASNDNKRH